MKKWGKPRVLLLNYCGFPCLFLGPFGFSQRNTRRPWHNASRAYISAVDCTKATRSRLGRSAACFIKTHRKARKKPPTTMKKQPTNHTKRQVDPRTPSPRTRPHHSPKSRPEPLTVRSTSLRKGASFFRSASHSLAAKRTGSALLSEPSVHAITMETVPRTGDQPVFRLDLLKQDA